MIDLIIPYYNNPEGLARILNSIDENIFNIIVIDDCSTIRPPLSFKVNQYYRYNINSGPGFARQHGINKTSNPYIMFIDTGDIFISKEIQLSIKETIEANSIVNVFCWSYYYKDKPVEHTDNRMHGKVYKREFLEKYNITFCAESSYMNEDIGFNRTCRLLTDFFYIDEPIIKWVADENSLTQKNDQEILYRDQTRALSLVSIHTIETCDRNKKDATSELNQIAIALYYGFLKTVIARPQFIQETWNGAKIFYKHFQDRINLNTLILGNPEIKKCLDLRSKVPFPINILKFAKEILHEENIPDYYLTFH